MKPMCLPLPRQAATAAAAAPQRRSARWFMRLAPAGFGVILSTLSAGCGGGADTNTDAPAPASASRQALASSGAGTQAAAATSVSTEQLFLWAQATYPDLFPDSPPIAPVTVDGRTYEVRSFINGNHLGVSNGEAYGLGPFTNGQLVNFGPVANYAATVCARIPCGTSPYAMGAVHTAVTVGAISPTTLTRTVGVGQTVNASFNGTMSGDVTSLSNQTIYLIIEDPLGVFVPNASLQVGQRGSGWGYNLTLTTGVFAQPGRYASKVNIYACFDAQCGTRLAGTPASISYDMSVH